MRDLTIGEVRMISESTNGWKMTIYQKLGDDISDALREKMRQLASDYETAFMDFYKKAVEEAEDQEPEDIQEEFDKMYQKEHPEFYDIDALIGGE